MSRRWRSRLLWRRRHRAPLLLNLLFETDEGGFPEVATDRVEIGEIFLLSLLMTISRLTLLMTLVTPVDGQIGTGKLNCSHSLSLPRL